MIQIAYASTLQSCDDFFKSGFYFGLFLWLGQWCFVRLLLGNLSIKSKVLRQFNFSELMRHLWLLYFAEKIPSYQSLRTNMSGAICLLLYKSVSQSPWWIAFAFCQTKKFTFLEIENIVFKITQAVLSITILKTSSASSFISYP